MIATPPTGREGGHRDLKAVAGLLFLYVFPGLLLWLAAWLSGGGPRPDVWNWPAVAIVSTMKQQPFAPWTWVGAPTVISPALFYAICAVAVLLLGAAGVVVYSVVQGGIVAWSPNIFRQAAGPARVSRRQLGRVRVPGPQPRRMIVGHRGSSMISTETGDSLLVLGPRGSGKTSAFCVPIIQEWSGPVLAAGVGQDLVGATAGIRQRQGRVDVYDPGAATNLATCTWSPVTGSQVMDVAVRRAGWMMPSLPEETVPERDDDVADAAAGALLAVSLWAAAHSGASVGELRDWLTDPACRLLRAAVERARPVDSRAVRCLAALARMSTPARAACCAAVETMMRAAEGDPGAAPAGIAGFDSDSLFGGGGGNGTLYVVAPPDEPQRTAPLRSGILGALLDEAFGLATGRPGQALDRPLLVVLDSTAGVAPVRELGQYLAVGGQLNVTLLVTFDDLGDVERGYGSLADEVVGSAQSVAVLGTQDDERTLRLIGDLARRWPAGGGHARRRRRSRVVQGLEGEALLDSARLFGPGQALLLSEPVPPIAFWTRRWYETPSLVELSRALPYTKGIDWAEVIPDGGPAAR
jgi:hypothetical protein